MGALEAGREPRRFLVVAGEASGDLHGARLVEALGRIGACRVAGIAGPALRAAGVEAVARMEEVAVLGFVEVAAALPRLLSARRRLLEAARRLRPHAVCLVDFPGFNLRLGPRLKAMGLKVFYYIAPQVWAWHPERARQMAAWTDRLAVVFEFERDLFRAAGVPAEFVGHPLLDGLEPEAEREAFLRDIAHGHGPLLALLPGSRSQEVERHLPILLAAARRLRGERPELGVVVACAPGLDPDPMRREVRRMGPGFTVVEARTRAAQAYSTAAAACSGTATLETALFGTPLVIVYRASPLTWALARRLVRLRRIGLPNIVAGEEVAEELLQERLRPETLAAALRPLLWDAGARARASARLARVRERLGGPGASARAAQMLWELGAS